MKKANELERLLYIIQTALSGNSGITVLKNHILYNLNGSAREFDIIIKADLNEIPIIVAIECKDSKRRVQVDKIEAFQSKCDRVPNINKKVFVSTKGFQKDAILAAAHFGIALFTLEELNNTEVWSWFTKGFKYFKPVIAYKIADFNFFFKSGKALYKASKLGDLRMEDEQAGTVTLDSLIDKMYKENYAVYYQFVLDRIEDFGPSVFFRSYDIRQVVDFEGRSLLQKPEGLAIPEGDFYLSKIEMFYTIAFREMNQLETIAYHYKKKIATMP